MRKVTYGIIFGLSLVLVIFTLQNTTSFLARFLWFSGEVPVILLLILAAAGGFILGLLFVVLNSEKKNYRIPKEYTERTYRAEHL